MALKALWNPNIQFLKTDGTINAGGKLKVTDHNDADSIPANYSDSNGTTLNPSPIVLDALGRATCYIDDASTYDLYVMDANGAVLWTVSDLETGIGSIIIRATGCDVSSADGTVTVTQSVDANGVVHYDLSIQNEITRATNAENALASSISGKANKVSGATSGHLAGLDASGNPTDSGIVASSVVQDADYVHTDNNYTTADKNKLAGIEAGAEANVIEKVKVNGTELTPDAAKAVDVPVPVAGSATPQMDGTASVGSSAKYAREDHVHPTDTSREAVANKTTVVTGSSDTTYPTDKAVADFVNSSVSTNTANYISDNGNPFTSLADLQAYSGTVTNNDYAFVTGTDSDGNTYYDRYKASVSGGVVTWAKEYRLNNSSFTAAQWAAISSGITSALVSSYSSHIANTNNPHNVTKTQVGLGNVDNTSDADKPISTAAQTALNAKLNTTGDGSNVTSTFTKSGSDTSGMTSGGKLSAIFSAISSFFASLKALAFKDKVGTGDVESGTYGINVSGNAATATTATTATNAYAIALTQQGYGTDYQRIGIVSDTSSFGDRHVSLLVSSPDDFGGSTPSTYIVDANFRANVRNVVYTRISGNVKSASASAGFGYIDNGDDTVSVVMRRPSYSGALRVQILSTSSFSLSQATVDGTGYVEGTRKDIVTSVAGANTAVGSSTIPTYVDENGSVQPCTPSSMSVGSATTATKLGSVNVGSTNLPIFLTAGGPASVKGYFFHPTTDPTVATLSGNITLTVANGGKYVYNVSTSGPFTITLASSNSSESMSFAIRFKVTASCPRINLVYKDAMEKTTITKVLTAYGDMYDYCFTTYGGYFHLVSEVGEYYS